MDKFLKKYNLPRLNQDEIEKMNRPFTSTEIGSSCHGLVEMNLTSIHEDVGSIPGLAQWVKDLVLLP